MTESEVKTVELHPLVEFLRDRRILLRIPQKTLAEMIGVRQAMISGWEHGKHLPSISHLDSWARSLGFRVRLVSSRKG